MGGRHQGVKGTLLFLTCRGAPPTGPPSMRIDRLKRALRRLALSRRSSWLSWMAPSAWTLGSTASSMPDRGRCKSKLLVLCPVGFEGLGFMGPSFCAMRDCAGWWALRTSMQGWLVAWLLFCVCPCYLCLGTGVSPGSIDLWHGISEM